MTEQVLYDDRHGLDLLIDKQHNVNMRVHPDDVTEYATHVSRDGLPMMVQFNPVLGTYYVAVSR